MPLVLADRVKETTTTAGTGTVTLAGASTGYQSFAVVGNGNTTYYCIAGQTTSEWEVGIGTYTSAGTTLARTTVLSNSAGTQPSALSFSAGTKDVFVTYPSGRSVNLDASSNLVFSGVTAQRFQADFTNATVNSRYSFQTSTANSTTGIYALPNGTSTAASWQATNAADPTNASKVLIATNGTTDVQLVSGINGTGSYLPLSFYNGGVGRFVIGTSGQFGIGPTASVSYGTSGQVLTSGGSGAPPTWASPSSGTASFVATGTISNGQTVALRSDGTVEVVSGSTVSAAIGTAVAMNSASNGVGFASVYNSNQNIVVIAYTIGTQPYVIAGSVSGTTITFGTAVVGTSQSNYGTRLSIAYDSQNQVALLVTMDGYPSYNLNLNSFTFSGTTVTQRAYGTPSVTTTGYFSVAASTVTAGSFLVSYVDNTTLKYARMYPVSVASNGAITIGNQGYIQTSNCNNGYIVSTFSSTQNTFLVYVQNTSSQGLLVPISVSGTTATTGSAATVSGSVGYSMVYCASIDRVVLAYAGTSNYPNLTVISVPTGLGAPTVNTPVVVVSFVTEIAIGWSTVLNKLAVAYGSNSTTLYANTATVSTTSVTLGTATTQAGVQYASYAADLAMCANGQFVLAAQSQSTFKGNALVYQASYTSTNAANYIGVAAQTISSGASGNITVAGGVNTGVSGLTVNSKYYVQSDGTLSTTNNGYPLVGRGLSATSILVTNSLN